jgi:hypothetical protein
VAAVGEGPVAATRPEVVGRRVLVRATGARHRLGSPAMVTTIPCAELPTRQGEPRDAARQTSEGWLSEASAALQRKGLGSRRFAGVEACLRHAALAAHRLTWWGRQQVPPADGQPPLGVRQLIGRLIAIPARVVRTRERYLALRLPPRHPFARRLGCDAPASQLALPVAHLTPGDPHC